MVTEPICKAVWNDSLKSEAMVHSKCAGLGALMAESG